MYHTHYTQILYLPVEVNIYRKIGLVEILLSHIYVKYGKQTIILSVLIIGESRIPIVGCSII